MKIKNVVIENNLILAPMADYTDVAFRRIAKQMGAGLTVTEMVSAKALMYESEKTYDLLETFEGERPVAVQIFGSDPEVMALACKNEALQKFDIIDINMGCPAPKIVKNKEGSALMQNMPLAKQIIEACVGATNKPVTVKFRAGWDESTINAVEFAKMCEKAGASAITIHGRTRAQFYSGKVNYEVIREVKQAVHIPVIGNGDVVDEVSYKKMLETGVDGVMIGRASMGNPWIFLQLQNKPYKQNKLQTVLKHIDYLKQANKSERYIVLHMRKIIAHYLKGIENANEQKQAFFKLETLEEVTQFLKKVLS
jgi:nifR3 family TIM-barrel protein